MVVVVVEGGGEGGRLVAGGINRKTGKEVNRGEKRRNVVKENRERLGECE